TGPMYERRNRVGYTEDYLIEGTWGSAICDNLLPQSGEPVFPKYRYDGLTSDAFRSWLRENEIKTLVLTGVATNVCVESTARDAYMSGYYVVMVEDCLATYSREEHEMALQNTARYFGNVATSHELLEIWRG
ncbi:MAG: cysteine hydrolase, partial [Chloroflexi bacterium]|nr:cysteine hydrolase [Chloroflexota bacterium]